MKVSKEIRDHCYEIYMKENFWLKKLKVFLTPLCIIPVMIGSIIIGIVAGILISIVALITVPYFTFEEACCLFWQNYLQGWFRKLWLHLFIWNKEKMAHHLAYSTMDEE